MNIDSASITPGGVIPPEGELDYEVRYYIKSFEREFPDRNPRELEDACQQAFNEFGQTENCDTLEAKARELLMR